MMTLEQRQEAASDVSATLMDWFPTLTGLECERIAKLAVAACDRALMGCISNPPESAADLLRYDGDADA